MVNWVAAGFDRSEMKEELDLELDIKMEEMHHISVQPTL